MNANEVIAGRANEILTGVCGGKTPVDPNDHVNRLQSSNDTFPTAMHVVVALELRGRLLPALRALAALFRYQQAEWAVIIKIGRTQLKDAVPMTLGQEASAWAQTCEYNANRIVALWPRLSRLAQGGTAVGTGLNAPEGFCAGICRSVRRADRRRAVGERAQQVRGAGDQRHDGRGSRHADHCRRRHDQDRQ
jgi:fumarate hydratase class II